MRLIDADELKEIYSGNGTFTSAHFRTAIDEMPTIEPEQKKGKWVKDKTNQRYCSACGQYGVYSEKIGTLHTFYCPYCGAKMEEEE